jgi:serine/threonine protein kinase
MALTAGTKLGPYEIQSPLGAGGMGEVYRARDTRLERTVAIKILPSHLSDNVQARQRFEREARAVSSLSHPNICTLYDVGQQDGASYLVMEYLEGETLADRLRKGPLPLDQVAKYGIEICEGLEKAHRSGVVHRDLKPGNIMLTKSGAKLMDFGLAKSATADKPPSSGLSATMAGDAGPLTAQGTIVGTFQYMSPEQVEGREADARSDIFSLGAVLYEMIAGKRAFEGKTTASTIAAILAAEPQPVSTIQPLTPSALDQIVRTCLAKDPDERWQSSGDVARQLRWISRGSQGTVPSASTANRQRPLVWAGIVLLAAVAAFLFGSRWAKIPLPTTQFEVNPPANTYFNFRGLSGPPVPSPDGSKIAFVAFNQGKTGVKALWLRSLDSSEARLLPGTEGAMYPFWSPDGRFLAFFASGKLKKLDPAGGSAIPLCDVAEGRGGAWSTDGVILFGNRTDSLFRVAASGGKPVQLTRLDEGRHETSHRWPQFFPDQKHFLFVAQSPAIPASHVFVAALDAPQLLPLEDVIANATYSNGNLVYVQDNSLLVRPFDARRLQFTGEPVAVAEHIQNDPQFNYAAFSVSDSTLIYQTGAVVAGTRLVSYDRSGKSTVLSDEQDLIQTVVLSPKEDQLAASLGIASGQLNDIWIYDLRRNAKTKLTFDQHSFSPVWSPDGQRLAFDRVSADGDEIVTKEVSGSGAAEVLFKVATKDAPSVRTSTPQKLYPLAWTPDEKYLIYRTDHGDINALSLTGEHKSFTLLNTKVAWSGAALSPDGKWLAYTSTETGIPEVYVVPFRTAPDGTPNISGGKWQVSGGGGAQALWRGDGKEMFISNTSYSTLMSVRVNSTAERFDSEKPQYLFDLDAHPVGSFYVVTRDGQKIYMATYGPGSTAPITVTTNWTELLRK